MRRFSGVFLVVGVLLAGGCGGAEPETTATVGVVGAERVLDQAVAAELSSFRMALTAEFGGLPEFGTETVSFGVDAAFAAGGDQGEMRLDFGDIMAAAAAEQDGFGIDMSAIFGDAVEIRFIGSTVYMSAGFWSWLFPVDTPWVAFTDDGSGNMDSGFDADSFSADEFLAVLRVIDRDAEIVGSETLDGVETVHVRGRASVAELAALDPDFVTDLDPTGTGAIDVDAFDVDVWIGPDDIVRRLRFGVDDLGAVDPTAPDGAFFRFTLDLSDVGEAVVVVAPPEADVTWIS